MKILRLALMATLALAACSPGGAPPLPPDCPRQTDKKPPIDGGIGGTGNQDACRSGDAPPEE